MTDAKAAARVFFETLTSGDFVSALNTMPDDGTWTIIGNTAISGKHTKAAMLSDVIPLLAKFKEAPQMEIDEIIAEGNRAVVLANVRGIGPHAPYIQKTYAFVLRVRDGKVVEVVEYLDTVAVEEAICGRKVVDHI